MSENEELLYKLAFRLSTFPGPRTEHPRLLVGSLPQALPIAVPVPEGSRVLGTLVQGPRALTVVLEVPLTQAEARAFYARSLSVANGWAPPEGKGKPGMARGGFVHGAGRGSYQVYTYPALSIQLNVQIADEEQGLSDVRLLLNQYDNPQIIRRREERILRHGPHFFQIFPALQPPDGGFHEGGGGGSGHDRVYMSSLLTMKHPLPFVELVKHYQDQLVTAGWTKIDEEQSERSTWSAWDFPSESGEPWQGLLSLFNIPGERIRYQLGLWAEYKDAPADDEGGIFSTLLGG